MTVSDWIRETLRRFERDDPRTALRASARELYLGGLRRANVAWRLAPTMYDREWDALVVLDGCRTDLMREVADEYEFLDSPGRAASPASQSREWLRQSFAPNYRDEMARTAHVSANPYTGETLDADDFLLLDEVWRYAWDDEVGTIPPRAVTDRAVEAGRRLDPDRLVVHYMQPHFPSLADPDIDSRFRRDDAGWEPGHAWDQLRDGRLSHDRLWRAYRGNLRCVLDEVGLLLDNLDADRVAVTADHGNATGEWGVYGHPPRMPLPSLHVVPWYETTASDTGGYEPATDRPADRRATTDAEASRPDDGVAEKLRNLGYLDE